MWRKKTKLFPPPFICVLLSCVVKSFGEHDTVCSHVCTNTKTCLLFYHNWTIKNRSRTSCFLLFSMQFSFIIIQYDIQLVCSSVYPLEWSSYQELICIQMFCMKSRFKFYFPRKNKLTSTQWTYNIHIRQCQKYGFFLFVGVIFIFWEVFLSPAPARGTHRVRPSRWVCPGDISVTVHCRWMKLHSWIEYIPKLCLARLFLKFLKKKCNFGDFLKFRT